MAAEMEEEPDQNHNNPPEDDVNNIDLPLPPLAASLIDTVTVIPPDAQRCRRNSGHSGWRCKSLSADNNLQYCQQHYDSRKNNPPSKNKKNKKKKLIASDNDSSPISAPIKLKIRRRRDLLDAGAAAAGGCSGAGGHVGGDDAVGAESGDCCAEKRRRKSKKVDCPCCVEPRVSFSADCLKKEHLWVELGHHGVDLNMNPAPAPVIAEEEPAVAAAADAEEPVAHDLGHPGVTSSGRNMEKLVVPPDELRCRRNDGVNWRCKNYWSSANDLRYCDKHYTTRVIGLRRKSTPRKTTPRSSQWGIQTKSIANDLGPKVQLEPETAKIDENMVDSNVEWDLEGKIDEIRVDLKVEVESGEKSDGKDAVEEEKVVESVEKVVESVEKVVESVEKRGNEEEEGGDLGNGGGFEESNGNVQKEENEVVEEIQKKKKKKKKKVKRSNRDEAGVARKSEAEIKEKKKKKKKRKREREIDSIFARVSIPSKETEGDRSVNEMAIQEDRFVDETAIEDAAKDTYDSDGILEAFAEIGKKKMKVETTKKLETTNKLELKRCSGEVKSTKSMERLVEMEKSLQHYKRKWLEMSVDLEKKKMECVEIQGKLVDVESRKVVADDEFKKYKRARRKKEERAQEKITYLEGKIEMIEKELEQGKKRAEDETEYWKKKFCDLEARILKMEDGNSTLRCAETHKSEKIESKVGGVQNEVTNNDENESDKCKTSKPDAEASGGKNGSHVSELQTKKNMLNGNGIDINKHPEAESSLPEHSALDISANSGHISCGGEKVEEGKGGRLEERTSHHGSSSQNHLEMSKKRSVNGVSDSDGENVGQSVLEDSDTCSSDPKISLGDVMDKLAMKYKNRNIDKGVKWEIETDMICAFEEDPELCMRAVCALFRQQRSEEKITADWLFHYSDALSRGTTLAEFLMDGDRRGDLKKSVEELDKFDAEGRVDCKRLAKSYSKQLFRVYQNKEDPFFHPSGSTTIP